MKIITVTQAIWTFCLSNLHETIFAGREDLTRDSPGWCASDRDTNLNVIGTLKLALKKVLLSFCLCKFYCMFMSLMIVLINVFYL